MSSQTQNCVTLLSVFFHCFASGIASALVTVGLSVPFQSFFIASRTLTTTTTTLSRSSLRTLLSVFFHCFPEAPYSVNSVPAEVVPPLSVFFHCFSTFLNFSTNPSSLGCSFSFSLFSLLQVRLGLKTFDDVLKELLNFQSFFIASEF